MNEGNGKEVSRAGRTVEEAWKFVQILSYSSIQFYIFSILFVTYGFKNKTTDEIEIKFGAYGVTIESKLLWFINNSKQRLNKPQDFTS